MASADSDARELRRKVNEKKRDDALEAEHIKVIASLKVSTQSYKDHNNKFETWLRKQGWLKR